MPLNYHVYQPSGLFSWLFSLSACFNQSFLGVEDTKDKIITCFYPLNSKCLKQSNTKTCRSQSRRKGEGKAPALVSHILPFSCRNFMVSLTLYLVKLSYQLCLVTPMIISTQCIMQSSTELPTVFAWYFLIRIDNHSPTDTHLFIN